MNKGLALFFCVLALLAVQAAFLLLQKNDVERVMDGATYIFRSEEIASNPQRIAGELLDMADRGLLSCPRVIGADGVAYLDRRDLLPCAANPWFLFGAETERTVQSITGSVWTVSMIVRNSTAFTIALWVTRALAIVVVLSGFFLAEAVTIRLRLHREHAERVEEISRQVAHDIRSPLSAIRILLQRAGLKPDHAAVAQASFERMDRIANDVLARGTQGPLGTRCFPQTVVERILREKQAEFADAPELVWSVNIEACPLVHADEQELGRLLSNLLNNSIEALPNRAGTISLAVRAASGISTVEIKDTGLGLSPTQLAKLGQRGWTTKPKGNGLGLHHAMQSVASWGGKLSVTSKEGVGTAVTIELRNA